MINRIRKLIPIFTLILTVQFTAVSQEKIIDQVVAVVGDEIVLQSDIEAQYMQYRAQGIKSRYGNLRCEILEELLVQKLLINQAQIDSIEVSESQVQLELDQRMAYFINQFGSEEEMEKYYNKKIVEIKEEMREMVRDQKLTTSMQSQIATGIEVTPSEVRQFYRSLPEDSIPLVNAEMELRQIVIYPPDNEEVEYEVRNRMLQLRERILKGESFSTLAVLYSEDPGSARRGGELGYRSRSEFVNEFAEAAWSLKKGGISQIVETEYGFHLIQLIDRKDDRVNCRHILLKPKVKAEDLVKAQIKLDSIVDLIKQDSLKFDLAAKIYSQDEDSRFSGGLMVNPRTGDSRFEIDHLDAATYYAIKDLNEGEFSAAFKATDKNGKDVYKVVLIKSKIEPHNLNLKQDYNRIQQLALQKKQADKVDKWVKEKIKTTYVHIDESMRTCVFSNSDWIK